MLQQAAHANQLAGDPPITRKHAFCFAIKAATASQRFKRDMVERTGEVIRANFHTALG